MSYRILIDENTSPELADRLSERGHDAVHVTEAIEEGSSDRQIAAHADRTNRIVLTHDDDFIHEEYAQDIRVFFYHDDTQHVGRLVVAVEQLDGRVPDPDDLPRISNLARWE